MIRKLFDQPHVLYQTGDQDDSISEPALALYVDNSGIVVLTQEDRDIIINKASIPELCKLLKKLAEAS